MPVLTSQSLRVAVVGLGSAGPAVAVLLADAGHEVVLLEREPDPGPVGAGIWLQGLGQQVLAELGVLGELRDASREVSRVLGVNLAGRTLMDFGYDAVPGATPALGVHRGTLFALLLERLQRSSVRLVTGVEVSDVRPHGTGVEVVSPGGSLGRFDLVVGADGARSAVRRAMGVVRRDRAYPFGALWAVVDDPDGLAGDRLLQVFDGTAAYFGVLPTGQRQASIFWSARVADVDHVLGRGVESWRREVRPFAVGYEPLVERVERLLPAAYRDVVVSRLFRVTGEGAGAVLVGDAAHAMSPQLGAGTSIALADALALARALGTGASLERSLAAYARDRAAHVRWYQWCSRMLVPVFQSDLSALAVPRDLLAGPLGAVPWVRRTMVDTLVGDRTSPWGRWQPS